MPRAVEREAHRASHRVASAGVAAVLAILVGLAAAGGCGRRSAAPFTADRPALRAALSADSAGLGDPVALRIEAIVPRGARVALEAPGDSIAGWRILHAALAVRKESGAWDRWERDLSIAAYRLGAIGPDTLRVHAVTTSGDTLRLAYAPGPLRVGGSLAPGARPDPSKARDIRDVLPTGLPLWPFLLGAAVVAAVGTWLGLRLARSRRARATAGEEAPAGPTPEEEFEAAIARLLSEGLLERGLYREFYYGVSRAVRLYLERKSGFPLLESTSGEVLSILEPRLAGELEKVALRDWLDEGDLVKYARMERLQAEAQRYLLRSRDLVRILASRPAAAPEAPESGAAAPAASGGHAAPPAVAPARPGDAGAAGAAGATGASRP